MLQKIKKWINSILTPPVFDDPDISSEAQLLHPILLSIPVLMLLTFPLTVMFAPDIAGHLAKGAVPVFLTSLGLLVLERHRRVKLASSLLLTVIWLSITMLVITGSGVRGPAFLAGYLSTIVLAGFLLGGRASIIVASSSMVVGFLLLIAETQQIWSSTNDIPPRATLGIAIFLFWIVVVVQNLWSHVRQEIMTRLQAELAEHMLAKEREINRRMMMEKVIHIGKSVAEQTPDFHTALYKIWEGVKNGLDFDRTAIFLYNSTNSMMQGSYGTNRSGEMSEEWDLKFSIIIPDSFFRAVLSQPDGYYFTQDYAGERNLSSRPGHPMEGVKYYAAVACWSGDKPVGIICVDQLTSQRIITDEQLEALRLFAGYAGLAIENTRLKAELEGHMQERENFIQELGDRNAELERFTYTVSHDLRSPLVTIKGFLGMLNNDLLKDQKDRVASDIQRISGAADKMDTLLSDLLELSRIGRAINPPQKIDLVKLAYETLETVDGRIRAKNISTYISPNLPAIYGDRVRLGEVLENLLDNAAKYMGDQPNPRIEIGSRSDNGEHVIYVKDNGMGIEPQYLRKVFGLFDKLNPASEGSGIGLALINRIIEVHGGRIWAESNGLGEGSTFCFTIPDGKQG